MLLRLYNDDTPLVDNSKGRAQKSRTQEAEAASPAPVEIVESDSSDAAITTNGVKSDGNLNAEEATTIVAALEPGVEEEKALVDEDRILAAAQQKADDTKEIAPGVTDEEDVFNKTV